MLEPVVEVVAPLCGRPSFEGGKSGSPCRGISTPGSPAPHHEFCVHAGFRVLNSALHRIVHFITRDFIVRLTNTHVNETQQPNKLSLRHTPRASARRQLGNLR